MLTRRIIPFIAAATVCLSIVRALPAVAPGFGFFQEFYGSGAYSDPQASAQLKSGSANGLTFTPIVSSAMAQLVEPFGGRLMLRLPAGSSPAGMSDAQIEQQREAFDALAAANPTTEFTWDLMPEWDQSGGAWVPNGRPSYTGLTKAAAHAQFLQYFQTTYPALIANLARPRSARNYRLGAIADYPPNVFDAFQMGAELCMLERGIDELGDLSTGMAFLRGASRQYSRSWGIDLSSWRTSNGSATQYNNSDVLLGGWSASYLSRHYYAAFLAGASVVHNEAATFLTPDGQPNAFSQLTTDFANFALRRHPDLGKPAVAAAFMISPDSGFDPKHGINNQSSSVWYQDIPYNSGDFMIDNLLKLAFPNFWQHGLAPGAPFANSAGDPVSTTAFKSFLAAGNDPRPYEPMPATRWGDNLDVVTTRISTFPLHAYKLMILAGDVNFDAAKSALLPWVREGGVLVLNSSQVSAADLGLAGVVAKSTPERLASTSTFLPTGQKTTEPVYNYTVVVPNTAEVIAVSEFGDPLITRQKFGRGEIWLTTADYLQSAAHDTILIHAAQLLDSLIGRFSLATVTGPPVEFVVDQSLGRITVGIINNGGSSWSGSIAVPDAKAAFEYVTDQSVALESNAAISVQVPAYSVRVFAFPTH